jgi:hypothetical protein
VLLGRYRWFCGACNGCTQHFTALKPTNDMPARFHSDLSIYLLTTKIECSGQDWRTCAILLMDFWPRMASEIYYSDTYIWNMWSIIQTRIFWICDIEINGNSVVMCSCKSRTPECAGRSMHVPHRHIRHATRCQHAPTFFRSLDHAIYLINVQLRIIRILTALCMHCLCLATVKLRDFEH